MRIEIRVAVALALFALWALATFYAILFIYFSQLQGLPQFLVGMAVLLTSMISYSYTTRRLIWKD